MKYELVRLKIKTGDVLGIYGRSRFSSVTRIVQWLAGLGNLAGITHNGIAWWVEGRLYSAEMDGKHNVLRPLSHYIVQGCAVNVYQCPVPESMAAQYDKATALPIKYSVFELFKIGLRLIFGRKIPSAGDSEMVCSTFAARWLQWSGWPPPKRFPDMPSPAELCRALGSPKLTIEAAK